MRLKTKTFAIICLVCVLLTTTSCINLLERIFFNSNGGGTYSFTIDMSEMKSMVEMMGEEMCTENLLIELDLNNTNSEEKLQSIVGINNIAITFDSVRFAVSLKSTLTT